MNGGEDLRYEDTIYYKKAKATKEAINALFDALAGPGRIRRKLIKLIFPEIVEVANDFCENVFWQTKSLKKGCIGERIDK